MGIRKMSAQLSVPVSVFLLCIAMLFTSGCSEGTKQAETTSAGKAVQYLFVQNAHGVSFKGDTMTMHGVGPSTLFFSDRPERIAGHGTTEEFVEDWAKGEDNFAGNPPNATLAILDDGSGEIEDIVVTIQNPRLTEGDLTYTVKVLDGTPPATGGPSSLFIDVIGRPLTPLSVAGVARRTTRRAVLR